MISVGITSQKSLKFYEFSLIIILLVMFIYINNIREYCVPIFFNFLQLQKCKKVHHIFLKYRLLVSFLYIHIQVSNIIKLVKLVFIKENIYGVFNYYHVDRIGNQSCQFLQFHQKIFKSIHIDMGKKKLKYLRNPKVDNKSYFILLIYG